MIASSVVKTATPTLAAHTLRMPVQSSMPTKRRSTGSALRQKRRSPRSIVQ